MSFRLHPSIMELIMKQNDKNTYFLSQEGSFTSVARLLAKVVCDKR